MSQVVDTELHLPKITSNTGPFADYSQVTRLSGTIPVVIRQRMVIADPAEPSQFANVDPVGRLKVTLSESNDIDPIKPMLKLMKFMLIELMKIRIGIEDMNGGDEIPEPELPATCEEI